MTPDPQPSVPADWTEPRWLAVFDRRALAWLAFRQDLRNRELRNIISRLRTQHERCCTTHDHHDPTEENR